MFVRPIGPIAHIEFAYKKFLKKISTYGTCTRSIPFLFCYAVEENFNNDAQRTQENSIGRQSGMAITDNRVLWAKRLPEYAFDMFRLAIARELFREHEIG
jgi:hypothetical protein